MLLIKRSKKIFNRNEAMDLFCAIRSFHERLHMSKLLDVYGPFRINIAGRLESYKPTLFADMHEIASKVKVLLSEELDLMFNSNVAVRKIWNPLTGQASRLLEQLAVS